jgi:hypothetical protein
MTMIGRTKYMGDTVLEIANKLLNQTMLDSPNDEEIKKPFRENKIRINHKYPVLFSLTSSLQNRAIFWDLKFKLLENTTKQPFIISDNPVVLYNQVLEKKRKFANNVGYATPGLEIFMPISPLKCIYFYDETFYNVGSKSKRTVCIKEEKDAESLNKLQLLNGNENVFFTNSITESYIHNLFNKSKKLRRLDKTNLVSQIDRKKEAPNNHSYMFTMNEIRTLLTLSFVFETQKAQNFDACSNPLLIRNLELFKKATRKIENFENRA